MANTRDNEIFNCDGCGQEFEWDDDCAEFDPLFLVLTLECKKCRGARAPSNDEGNDWKKDS